MTIEGQAGAVLLLLVLLALGAGCATSPATTTSSPEKPIITSADDPSLPWACNQKTYDARLCQDAMVELAQRVSQPTPRHPDDGWSVRCTVDQVTAIRRCFAGAFGQSMGANGEPYGRKMYPFQVLFADDQGPFLFTLNTFPGRNPIVRVDESKPVTISTAYSDVTAQTVQSLVQELRAGKIARIRYHVWPKGSQDMVVDLTGFDAAWQELLALNASQ